MRKPSSQVAVPRLICSKTQFFHSLGRTGWALLWCYAAMPVDLTFVEETVGRLGGTPDTVIPILQALQDHYGYLPESALQTICARTQITPASITGVSSFYDMFRHKPVGRHLVRVCRGTACHVTGAERVEAALRRHLGIAASEDTDPSEEFT